ncbi:hypothetical protein D0Z00_000490 [Geotrichum galactomycetum]|uniref:Uncharacterized protein n=1 Tax=Geotrichum galactomycetum TaxID=27317 RepID=A0ACB6V9V0_9ASCO|nr:hypothetical protein D0Z00_000490 [Geotrichum candidum]
MPLPSTTPVPKADHAPTTPATVPALPIFKGSILYSVDEFLGTFNTVAAQADLTEQEKLLKVFSYIDKTLEPVLSILRTCSYNDWATFERLLRTAYAVDTHGLEYVNHIINTFKANTPGFGVLVFLECYFAYTGVLCGSGELAYAQRFQLLVGALPGGFVGYLKRYLPDAERWLSDVEIPVDMESWDRLIGLTRQYAASLRDEKLGDENGYLLAGEHAGLTTNSSKGSSPVLEPSTCESSPIAAAKMAKRARTPATNSRIAMGIATTDTAAATTTTTTAKANKRSPYQLDDKERRVWELFLAANRRVRQHLISITILEPESDENENYGVDDILKNTEGSVFPDDDDAGLGKPTTAQAQRSKNNNNDADIDESSSSDWSEPKVSVAEIMREFSRAGLTPQGEAVLVERYAEPLTGHKMSEFVNYPEDLLAHVFEVVLTYTYTTLAASKV